MEMNKMAIFDRCFNAYIAVRKKVPYPHLLGKIFLKLDGLLDFRIQFF